MNMKNEKFENWVAMPRRFASDRRSGNISSSEFALLMWLRVNGNPYGIAVVSLKDINEDVFDGKFTISYVNKLILSLRKKRYIHYESRAGRRGSFEVHFGDWILPDKNIRSLDRYFEQKPVEPLYKRKESPEAEDSDEMKVSSQSSKDIKDDISKMVRGFSTNPVRGSNNETNNKNDNKNDI